MLGDALLSGGDDGAVRAWAARGWPAEWRCAGTRTGHRGAVRCLAAWGGRGVSGGADGTVRVWAGDGGDSWAGGPEHVLRGHRGAVCGLAAAGEERLVSGGADGSVRVWSCVGWSCVGVVGVGCGPGRRVWSVGVSGARVVAGCEDGSVWAWEVATLEAAGGPGRVGGGPVRGLVSDEEEGRVWGCVGREVVVWG